MLVNVIIWVANALFSLSAVTAYLCFLGSSRYMFILGLFNNVYWLCIGAYYGWYANVTITVYFMLLNIFGNKQWGKKPIKQNLKLIYLALFAFLILTLLLNIYIGFKNKIAILNFCNVTLYSVCYTLRLWPKYKRHSQIIYLINQCLYLPNVLFATPVLWACVCRQVFMVYANVLTLVKPKNWLTRYINKNKNK